MGSELESGPADQAVDIYTLAMECKALFATYLRDEGAEGSQLRQYEHRFLLWASFLGVYADEKSCLDRRLRRAPEIRDLVLLMLRVLKRNLGHAISESVDTSATSISRGDQNGPMYGIKEAIDRLHRIAAIIRGGTRTDEVQAVRRFASKREPDGFLGVIMALTQYHFPKAQASLHFQLAKSVTYRRNWLLYQQQHSQKLAKPRAPRNVPPLPIIVEPEPASRDQAARNTYPQCEIRSQISSTQPSIRNLNTQLLENLNIPEQSGASQQDATSAYSRNPPPSGLYPTPPSFPEGQRETLCKYCQNILPTSVVKNEAKWRKHLDADLRPYVCVSEHCGDFSPSFSTVRDWKSHMEEKHRSDWPRYVHRARWTCPRCPKEPEKAYFPTEVALARHLSEDAAASHHPVLDAMEISRITAGCKEFNPIGEDDCPLCGPPPWQEEWKPEKKAAADVSEKPGNESNLNVHFTSHLIYLAFQSLRWWDVDINGEEDEPAPSQDAAGFNSKGSAGTAAHEGLTAVNIDLDDEELKAFQQSRACAEEEELQEKGDYTQTFITWDVDINREEDDQLRSQAASGFDSGSSAGISVHEDSTAINIDWADEELTIFQESRTHAEEEERLDREKHIPTSATETAKSSIATPARMETLGPIDSLDDLDLRDKISEAMQDSNEGKKFIPADAIVWLASRETVKAELMDSFSDELVAELVNYVLTKPAIKVFLILVMCKNISAMDKIRSSGFGDQHLPLDEQIITKDGKRQRQLLSLSQLSDPGPVLEPLRSWRVADRREFLERQWAFMAPIFTTKKFAYKLHNRCPLPFIPFTDKDRAQGATHGGLSGSVKEIKVHEAHQKVLPQKDGKPIRVALKTIWPQMGHYFHQEEDTLRVIQKVNHPHLIKPIASYQYDNQENGCFLFPWAEHGNLKEFWKTENVRPLKNPEMMGWMLKQMRGLCHALSILHDAHRRHGDIKPENILLFEEGDYKGTLRIADVGLAKFYAETTEQRILLEERTKPMEGTTRYVSPEFVHGNQIPRVFDVWALGCVFIEFIIWTLHGYDGLFDFRKACSAHFWEEVNGTFVIHAEVRAWISNLEQILRGSETALESLLGLVELHMLVPDYERRSSSIKVHEKLVEICRDAENDPRYLIDPEVESRARTNPPRLRESSKNLALPERPRTRLAPISKKQGSFHIRVEGPDDWDDSSSLMVNPINPTFRAQQDDKYISYTRISNVNNEFAQNLFSNPDWSHPYPAQSPSKFCEKCSSLDIWQPGFEFGGLVGDIRARSKGCDLCLLFTQAVSKLKWEDNVRLLSRRMDSVIRIMPNGPTILSLYSDPEQILASPDAQIGYPLLPKPGSLSQFAFIREWLRVCRETHDHEHLGDGSLNPTELPTRVIDLGVPDKPQLQLVTGGNMESHEYFALSHCWGKSMRFRALKENIEALTKAIDFRRLPRTFKEAIKTARGLNVRYLWIDSLCIIQDDQDDWKREAARMQQVFSNATCVIAASSAGSSAEAFLETPREERPFVTLCSPSGATSYVCEFIDNFAQDMEEAPLNQRGWVLQERALARRSIHFTSTQVYLECGEGVQCESLMKLANDKVAILGDSDFPNSVLAYYKGGRLVLSQNLFKMYSRLKFTNSSDRAVAISGLEKRLMSAFKTRGGYGVFQVFFERSVLWQRPESGSLASIAYPADRNVPSWSWMSYDGSITYVDAPFEKVDWTKDYESPFEAKTGRQYWGIHENNPSPIIKSKSARRFSPLADPERVLERIRFDLETSEHLPPGALRCIVIGKARSSEPEDDALHYVLVITASSSGKPEAYVRVGVGVLLRSLISWGSEEYVEVH